MRSVISVVVATALAMLAAVSVPALACSCIPSRGVTGDFDVATTVFLGEVISVERMPSTYFVGKSPSGAPNDLEIATFRVQRAWKGPHRPGDRITFRSIVSGGMCGQSVGVVRSPDRAVSKPRANARIWLIYAYGKQPYELTFCSRSLPVDVPQAQQDVRVLDSVSRASGKN